MKRTPIRRGTSRLKQSKLKSKVFKNKSESQQSEIILDKLVYQILLLRDQKCIQCGSIYNLGTGHVFPRRCRYLRWNLENVWLQCASCNHNHNLHKEVYFDKIRSIIGADRFQILETEWNQSKKLTIDDIQQLIKSYLIILANLKGEN